MIKSDLDYHNFESKFHWTKIGRPIYMLQLIKNVLIYKIMSQSIGIFEQTLCEKFAFNLIYIDFSHKIDLTAAQKNDLKIALQETINLQNDNSIHFTPEILKSILDLLSMNNVNIAVNELINYIHSRWLKEKNIKLDIRGFKEVFNHEQRLYDGSYNSDIELRACNIKPLNLS